MSFRLYLVQRLTAAAMVPFIAIHLVLIVYASRNGLSASEILERTQGSVGWGAFYVFFVALAGVHGAIGMRNVFGETTRLTGPTLDLIMWTFGILLVLLGLRAVVAVVGA